MTVLPSQNKVQVFDDNYLRKLPLLDFTANLYPDVDLSSVYVICAQHVVSTTYSLFNALFELGLAARNVSAIGK